MVEFEILTEKHLTVISQWFDDPESQRWLGGPEWAENTLRLAEEDENRCALVALLEGHQSALLDIEKYPDFSASFAIVVDPATRGQGVATKAILVMLSYCLLDDVDRFVVGVENGNTRSEKLLRRCGFEPLTEISDKGFVDFQWRR